MTAVRSTFPHTIRVVENAWIPLSDGCRLAARLWLPEDADERPVPAVLEYLPYRKGDVTAIDDSLRHPYFAGHGYAALRVDIRGTGDSDGILLDEYHKREHDDALEVLSWIAAQPWCTGDVGMMGISWGGFNSLQVAARRPPELKAIITACSTDDRYADDVHYMGGCVLGYYLLPWAAVMLAYGARPPDPAVVGERWREIWLERLKHDPFLIETWLRHQRRDDYWKQGSICEDYDAVTCPVYIVGGWADAYTNAALRMLEFLSCPRKGLIGPWGHMWPEQGVPGPAVGFLQEAVRWWDHWLKGADNGLMDEPMLRVWMQDAVEPQDFYAVRPGHWVTEPSWPSPRIESHAYALAAGRLTKAPAEPAAVEHEGPLVTHIDAGAWCGYGNPGDLPRDQRVEDAGSLSFDSDSLGVDLPLLGRPELELSLAVNQPHAFLVARLCDVAPTGTSTLVSRAILNLCHRDGHETASHLEPGRRYRVSLRLKAVGYVVPASHRLRLALSTSYWPWIWPPTAPVRLTVFTGSDSVLQLPIRPPREGEETSPELEPPETAPPLDFEWIRPRTPELSSRHDLTQSRTELRMARAFWGARRLPDGLEYHDEDPVTFSLTDGDPLSARVDVYRRIEIKRDNWRTRVEVRCTMTGDADTFRVSSCLEAYEHETRIFTRTHACAVPRDHN